MTIETPVALPPRTTHDEWRDRRWRLTGLLVGVMALVVAALLLTTGVRPATYGDLLSDVSSSKVGEVQVVGVEDPAPGDAVELRWTVLGGVLDQYAVVRIEGDRGQDAWQESEFVTSADPRDTLRSINPDIVLTEGSFGTGPSTSYMDWRAAGWVILLALATWTATLLMVIGGPEPWRATRWAWGWCVLLAGPLGAVAYLLLGGPLGLARPRPGHRRLTGGWAFLLAGGVFGGTNGG